MPVSKNDFYKTTIYTTGDVPYPPRIVFETDEEFPVFNGSDARLWNGVTDVRVVTNCENMIIREMNAPDVTLDVKSTHKNAEELFFDTVTCKKINLQNGWQDVLIEDSKIAEVDTKEILERFYMRNVRGHHGAPVKLVLESFTMDAQQIVAAHKLNGAKSGNDIVLRVKFPVCPV